MTRNAKQDTDLLLSGYIKCVRHLGIVPSDEIGYSLQQVMVSS